MVITLTVLKIFYPESKMGKISHRIGKELRSKTFHRFPEMTSPVGQKWVAFVRSKLLDPNWMPEKKHKLCSRHFTEDCFLSYAPDKCKALKENAIPTKLILPQTKKTQGDEWNKLDSQQASETVFHSPLALPNDKKYLKQRIEKLKRRIAKVEKQAVNRSLAINSQQERCRKLEKSRDEIMSKLMVYLQKDKNPKKAKT